MSFHLVKELSFRLSVLVLGLVESGNLVFNHKKASDLHKNANVFGCLLLAGVIALGWLVSCSRPIQEQDQIITTSYEIPLSEIPEKEDIDSIRVYIVVSGDTISTDLYKADHIENDLVSFDVEAPPDASIKVQYVVYSGEKAVAAGNVAFSSGDSPKTTNPSLPPEIHASADTTVYRGQKVSYNWEVKKQQSEITAYSWDYDGDGEIDVESLFSQDFYFSYTDTGTYTAWFYVVDALGLKSADSVKIQVKNPPPEVDSFSLPSRVTVGDVVELEAIAHSSYGEIVNYEWDLDGDGIWDTTGSNLYVLKHRFLVIETVNVIARITDSDSNFTMVNSEVKVNSREGNVSPEIIALNKTDTVISIKDIVGFEVDFSDENGRSDVITFQWDLDGDGEYDEHNTARDLAWAMYDTAGIFTVKVLLTDASGASDSATTTLNVVQGLPTVKLNGVTAGGIGDTLTFTAEASDSNGNAPSGRIDRYDWDLDGDGIFERICARGTSQSVVFPDDYESHTYKIFVRITDDDGNVVLDSSFVTISNRDPEISEITASQSRVSIQKAAVLEVNAHAFFDADENQIDSIYWNFSDETNQKARSATDTIQVIRNTEQELTVTATVKDNWGATDTASIVLTYSEGSITLSGANYFVDMINEEFDLTPEISFELNQSIAFCDWSINGGDFTTHKSCDTTIVLPNTPVSDYRAIYKVTSDVGTSITDTISIMVRDAFVDDRDGTKYASVNIGDQVWMGENLNYSGDDSLGNKTYEIGWCYGVGLRDTTNHADSTTCDTYGRLYNWYMILNGDTIDNFNPSNVQGICPDGWHIPNDEEWRLLLEFVIANTPGISADDISSYLKTTTGWAEGGNGTDDFGFSALPSGARLYDGSFYRVGYHSNWWSSTEYTFDYRGSTRNRIIQSSNDIVNRQLAYKFGGYSLRCLRD